MMNLKQKESCKQNIMQLNLLNGFLKEIDYKPNVDFYISIIESSKTLNNILESVVENNNNLDELSEDKFVKTIIEVYCMVHDIGTDEIDNEIQNLSSSYIDINLSENDNDTLKYYLQQIGSLPLLSLEEEKRLAYQVSMGDEEARDIFIERNLRLVVYIAKKHVNRGLPLEDLIQEGNIGLMKAVDKFDVTKGYKFSTFAIWWIRQAITRSLYDTGRTIRIPVHQSEKLNKINRAQSDFRNKFGRDPKISEMADITGIKKEDIEELLQMSMSVTSLNSPITEDNDEDELGDFIPSNIESPEESVVKDMTNVIVRDLFNQCNLTPREIEVLKMRLGFYGRPFTLEEIGEKFHVTRERVRQLETKGLRRLRNSVAARNNVNLMDNPEQALKNLRLNREHNTQGSKKFISSESEIVKKKVKKDTN